ncbi:curli-like amyloid fiber formation chaperone CsgH [Dichotomicrobium thermohalophilum]|uniref:CsgH-like domain-containing protein n=1 Tax=Dichotomicrobium thermohalophilum TaxID=933063 RepID=A0A397QCI4_9HYPH|nr:curli-like amyloid fiber formation chaperone CsgH [Dichotomicrobium thermohalophilum]RIA55961.1 hypothetical protein BXY53_1049 [Dichotomicrobium thermohalophilum]
MTKRNRNIRRALAGAALTASMAAMGAGFSGDDASAGWFTSDRVRCEIEVTPRSYGVELRGVVFSEEKVSGRYELTIEQEGMSGQSHINQAGGFAAYPGSPAQLGMVSLGGTGTAYTAKLKVHAGGETFVCAKRIGGHI